MRLAVGNGAPHPLVRANGVCSFQNRTSGKSGRLVAGEGDPREW